MSESRRFPSVDAFTDSWFNESNPASVDQNEPTSVDLYMNVAPSAQGVQNEAEGYVRVPSGYMPSPSLPNDAPEFGPPPASFAFLDGQSRQRVDYMVLPDPAGTAPSAASWDLPQFDFSFAKTFASVATPQPSPQPNLTWPAPQAQPDITRPWTTGMSDAADMFAARPTSRPNEFQPQSFTPAFSNPQPETSFASRNAPPPYPFFDLPSSPLLPPNPPRNMASFPGNGGSAAGIAVPSAPSFAPVPGPMAAPATPVQPFAGQATSYAMPNWPVEAGLKRFELPPNTNMPGPVTAASYANPVPPARPAPAATNAPYGTWPLVRDGMTQRGMLGDDYASAKRLAFGHPPEVLRPLSPMPAFTSPPRAASPQPGGLGALPKIQPYGASGIGTSAGSGMASQRATGWGFHPEVWSGHNQKRSDGTSPSRFVPIDPKQLLNDLKFYIMIGAHLHKDIGIGDIALGAAERANAFVNGAYSIFGGVGSAFRQLDRGTGVLGDEQFRKFTRDSNVIGFILKNAIEQIIENPEAAFKLSIKITSLIGRMAWQQVKVDPLFMYYIAGRVWMGVITGLGPASMIGSMLDAIESGDDAIESLIEKIIFGL